MYFDHERTINLNQKNHSWNSNKSLAHTGPVVSLIYTTNGHRILSLGKDNSIRLWDSSNGLNTLVNYGKIPLNATIADACLQMSATEMCNPNYAFIPGANNMLMYNILDGDLVKSYKGHFESTNCCLFNSALNEVYSGSKDRNILIWSKDSDPVPDIDDFKPVSTFQNVSYSYLSNTGRDSTTESLPKRTRTDNWSDDES